MGWQLGTRAALAALVMSTGLVACGDAADTVGDEPDTGGFTTPPTASASSSGSTLPAQGATPAKATVVPKLFVRGFGADFDILLGGARSFDAMKKLMHEEGFDPKDAIDLGNYDDSKSMDVMTTQVGTMLEAAMKKYPEGTMFDVLGHSLGGILGLRGILEKGLHGKVRTFVALSAPIFGQDKKPLNCQLGFSCGDIYTFYSPFNGEKILQYMKANETKLKAMKLCSILGPDDGTINAPMKGGQFPETMAPNVMNIEIPKVSHIALIKSGPAVKALKADCFGGAF